MRKIRFSPDIYDYTFIAIVLVLLAVNTNILIQLNSLPSPLYGGDYYNHLGTIEYLYQGGSIFESAQLAGEIHWVPWLYHVLVVVFAKVTFLSPILANIWFSQLVLVLSCALFYLLVSKAFENKIYGLLAVLWLSTKFPVFKYTPFSVTVSIPLFLLAAYYFLKHKNWWTAAALGIAYGIAGISNTHAFIYATFFVMFLFFHMISDSVKFANGKIKPNHDFWKNLMLFGALFTIGFAISMLWWFKPIFVYHGHTPNAIQSYGLMNVRENMFLIVWVGLKRAFFSIYDAQSFIYSTFPILAIILLFFVKHKKPIHHLMIIGLCAGLFGLLSHFITEPLLDNNIGPTVLFDASNYMAPIWILLCLFTLKFFSNQSQLFKIYHLRYFIIGVVALIFMWSSWMHYTSYDKSYWFPTGQGEVPAFVAEPAKWVKQNTNLNDVFLTTNEDSFALNALTGRKMVTYRRTHASLYADMNQRMLDAALMLYGNNDTLREELLREYDVKYLYWEPRWLQNEFIFDQNGQMNGFFDPLMMDYTSEREQTLKQNNVSYLRQMWYLDPAWMPEYPKRDVLIVLPSRMSMTEPWTAQLDPYLEQVYNLDEGGQSITKIFKIKPADAV